MSKRKLETEAPGSSSEIEDVESPKRKRKNIVPSEDELEIDVNLPEPPSKKAKRELRKKEKRVKKEAAKEGQTDKNEQKATTSSQTESPNNAASKRSDYGIWVGNLPFTATKDSLRQFLKTQGSIEEADIVRVHMPAPVPDKNDRRPTKPQNKGFAYVDFTTKAVLDAALELTEELLGGRKVLIKNAKSYEGRPEKPKAEDGSTAPATVPGKPNAKPPAKRIFVGNLDFAITEEDLREHFGQAGEVENVHMATFEDSGKCKGFGWIRFVTLEAAEAAVRGFIFKTRGEDDEDEDDDSDVVMEESDAKKNSSKKKKEKKKQKWFINRLNGRELRCEFAEDSAVRYKKRFGKDVKQQRPGAREDGQVAEETVESIAFQAAAAWKDKGERPKRKFDARNVAPAKALANAARSSAAIVAGKGKKVTFD